MYLCHSVLKSCSNICGGITGPCFEARIIIDGSITASAFAPSNKQTNCLYRLIPNGYIPTMLSSALPPDQRCTMLQLCLSQSLQAPPDNSIIVPFILTIGFVVPGMLVYSELNTGYVHNIWDFNLFV